MIEIFLFVLHARVAAPRMAGLVGEHSLTSLDWSSTDAFVDLGPLAYWHERRQLLSIVIILAWLKLLEPLSDYFKDVFVLVDTMNEMVRKLLAGMFPVLLIVYFAWGLAKALLSDMSTGTAELSSLRSTRCTPTSLASSSGALSTTPNDARGKISPNRLHAAYRVQYDRRHRDAQLVDLDPGVRRVRRRQEGGKRALVYVPGENVVVGHKDKDDRGHLASAAMTVAGARGAHGNGETEPKLDKRDPREKLFEKLEGKLLKLTHQTFGDDTDHKGKCSHAFERRPLFHWEWDARSWTRPKEPEDQGWKPR